MKELLSSKEHADKQRYASPYIWGVVAALIALVGAITVLGYLVSQR